MPHVNYHRAETRTFVVRHELGKTRGWRRLRGRRAGKNSLRPRIYAIKAGFSLPGGLRCTCCAPLPGDKSVTRRARNSEKIRFEQHLEDLWYESSRFNDDSDLHGRTRRA